MTSSLFGFIIGAIVGVFIGIFIMCLCQAAADRDNTEDDDDIL